MNTMITDAALTNQQIYDRFAFLEGLVSDTTYHKIANVAIQIQKAALSNVAAPEAGNPVSVGERERFEAWCDSIRKDRSRCGDGYLWFDTDMAWFAWQECHKQAALAVRQPVGEVLAYLTIDDPINGEAGDWDIETSGEALDRLAQSVAAECRIPLYAAPPQQPERVDLSFMSLRGDDKRVNVDSYKEAIEAARSNIGARRPDDDEPEDQWYWDKLTSLLALINQQESKP